MIPPNLAFNFRLYRRKQYKILEQKIKDINSSYFELPNGKDKYNFEKNFDSGMFIAIGTKEFYEYDLVFKNKYIENLVIAKINLIKKNYTINPHRLKIPNYLIEDTLNVMKKFGFKKIN